MHFLEKCSVFALASCTLLCILLPFSSKGEVTALEKEPVIITMQNGNTLTITAEMARTPSERAKGLMHRESLAKNHGMLFTTHAPQMVSFWMKNTPLPLDILCIDVQGEVIKIFENAEPYSLTPLPCGAPVIGVLEIAGGSAKTHNITKGDRVSHAYINTPTSTELH